MKIIQQPKGELVFPNDFFWGASTAAHQVEGNNTNDWTEWEKLNAYNLASGSRKKYSRLSSWKRIKPEAEDPKNYISGEAVDHYNRYDEDFNLAKELNLNSYRFSVEWSRIEPEEGKFDESAIKHYNLMLSSLHDKGIEPFVTLWHWTLPTWIRDIGGWNNPKTIEYFCRYVHKIVAACPSVRFWITLNEPEIYTEFSYLLGQWPPQIRSYLGYFRVYNNLLTAHNHAYYFIKDANPVCQVGIAQNRIYFEAYKGRIFNRIAAAASSWWLSSYSINKIKSHVDFLGLNFYFRSVVNLAREPRVASDKSDLGWEIYPKGIYHVLMALKKFEKPIYITENGIADARDKFRSQFIKDTLGYVHKAIMNGADVKGYFHWSLLDNFEWDKGFWPRFGLIEVNRKTLTRTIRPSAREYARIAKENLVEGSNII